MTPTRISLAVALLLVAAGCRRETAVSGRLDLEPGYIGDVRGSRVELHLAADLSDEPVVTALSEAGPDQRSSEFRLTGMPAGMYYLLAWRDADGNGRISDRDIVGVGGGTYRPGYGGGPIQVFTGANTGGLGVKLRTWRAPVDTIWARRSRAGDTTEFSYRLNYDLVITSLSIYFPGLGTLSDPDAVGPKTRGVVHVSGGWTRGGQAMPAGRHLVSITGRLDGEDFSISSPVEVE